MVKKLSKWGARFSPPGLFPINRIKRRIREYTERSKKETIRRYIFLKSIVIDKHVSIGSNHKEPSNKRDQVRSNP